MAQCRICDKIYKRKSGSTGGMAHHLMREHRQFWEMYVKGKKEIELYKQRKTAPDGSGK
jgi:hypothetical protein